MNTTQALNSTHRQDNGRRRAPLGLAGKVLDFWRGQQRAQELYIKQQTPWLSRH